MNGLVETSAVFLKASMACREASSDLEADCATLYFEDFQDGQVIEGPLAVRNPFIV